MCAGWIFSFSFFWQADLYVMCRVCKHWRWTILFVYQNYFDEKSTDEMYFVLIGALRLNSKNEENYCIRFFFTIILPVEFSALSIEHWASSTQTEMYVLQLFRFHFTNFFFCHFSHFLWIIQVITTRRIHVTIVSFISNGRAFSDLLVPLSID